MVTSRFENLDEDKQDEILNAAAEEFADKGFERASINRIIEAAGISKGSMYYYFEDKADLFSTTVRVAVEHLLEQSGGIDLEAMTAESFWDDVRTYSRNSMPLLNQNPTFVRLAQTYFSELDSGEHPDAVADVTEFAIDWTRRFIERGRELGVVRRDLSLEYLTRMINAIGEVGDQWLMEHWEDLTEEEAIEIVQKEIDLMKRMLEPTSQEAS